MSEPLQCPNHPRQVYLSTLRRFCPVDGCGMELLKYIPSDHAFNNDLAEAMRSLWVDDEG